MFLEFVKLLNIAYSISVFEHTWGLDSVKVILEPACRLTQLLAKMLLASNIRLVLFLSLFY